jgi:hypothetical protein
MSIVQFQDEEEIKEKPKRIIRKPKNIKMNEKPKLSQINKNTLLRDDNNYFVGIQPEEINFISNDLILKGSTLAIKPTKRQELYTRLKTSKYINLYIDKYLNFSFLDNYLNDHLKALAAYSVHYLSTMMNNREPLPNQEI